MKKRSSQIPKRKQVYWWTEEISSIRRECVRLRRKLTRLRGRGGSEQDIAATKGSLKEAKKRMRGAIYRSCETKWQEMCQLVESDPWGKPYKIAMGRMGAQTSTGLLEPSTLEDVVQTLFPAHPPLEAYEPPALEEEEEVPLFTRAEIRAAVTRVRGSKKAPGPDAIPNKIWGMVNDVTPEVLENTFNRCLKEGVFPERWKRGRLVLLKKPGKPDGSPSSYRPLTLLDDVGKLYERLLAGRLETHIESQGGLATNQYGFRKGRSTDDAAGQLKKIALDSCQKRELCAAVSLDVQNAFNTLPWKKVIEALQALHTPPYLMRVLRDYLDHRTLQYGSPGAPKTKRVIAGVPQGSELGSPLWNFTFDGIMRVLIHFLAYVAVFR